MKYKGKYSLNENLLKGRGMGLLITEMATQDPDVDPQVSKSSDGTQPRKRTGCKAERIVAFLHDVPLNKYQLKGESTHYTVAFDVDGGSGKQFEVKSINSSSTVALECKEEMGGACAQIVSQYDSAAKADIAAGGKGYRSASAEAGAAGVDLTAASNQLLDDKFGGGARFLCVHTERGGVYEQTRETLQPKLKTANYRTSEGGGVACTFKADKSTELFNQPYDAEVDAWCVNQGGVSLL